MPSSRVVIPKREEELRARLMAEIRKYLRHFVCFRHEDIRTSGVPDIEINGNRVTTHWETKHGTPKFESSGIQELTNQRLARQTHSRYIIWQEGIDGFQRTLIVHPDDVKHRQSFETLIPERVALGFDMYWLVLEIARAHGVKGML